MKASDAFRNSRAVTWTRERVEQLAKQEIVNLQANAERLAETELVALCAEVLRQRPLRDPTSNGAGSRSKSRTHLVSRSQAFALRDAWPMDPRTSWSAVRKSDGMVVMAIWAKSVQSRDGGCGCLLWAPNGAGARPWSDTPAGRERREHCKLALEHGCAEGLLVHGESLEGRLPEDRARTVLGIDPKTTITFKVELRGNEYWARWGTTP